MGGAPEGRGAHGMSARLRAEYTYEPGLTLSRFLRALGERRVEGGRCSSCAKVYVPPRVRCPACGTGPMTPVPVDDRGTIVSYTVVHVPVAGALTEPPFAWAWIRLDGADATLAGPGYRIRQGGLSRAASARRV